MRFTHVWFDLGQTLIYLDRAKSYQKILKVQHIQRSVEEIERAYHLADKLFMREYPGVLGKKPGIFRPWYYGVLNYYLGVELELEVVCKLLNEARSTEDFCWRIFEFSRDVILELKKNGIKVGLISNWNASCRNLLQQHNLHRLLDAVIISSEVGYEKPSEEIFRLAIEKSGADPSRSLYVGDNYYDDVIGSAKVGMACLLINPYGKLGMDEIDYPHIIRDIREVRDYIYTDMNVSLSCDTGYLKADNF